MFLQGWVNGILINESSVYGTLCIVLLKILNMGLYFSEIDTRGWPYRRRDLLLPFNHSFAPFDIHVSSVYQTHTCMQAPIPTLCISAKMTHNKGSRTRPIMSTLMPRSGIPVICSRATLSCDSSYCFTNPLTIYF